MAVDLEQINLKFTASIGNVSKTFSALESRLSKLQTALNGLNTSNLDKLASSVDRLASASNAMSNNDSANKAMRSLATSLKKFESVNSGSVINASNALTTLGNAMSTFMGIDPVKANSLSILATSLNSFGRVKPLAGIEGLAKLGTSINQFMVSLDGLDPTRMYQLSQAILNFASGLNLLAERKSVRLL